jgi:hypothetical protein
MLAAAAAGLTQSAAMACFLTLTAVAQAVRVKHRLLGALPLITQVAAVAVGHLKTGLAPEE